MYDRCWFAVRGDARARAERLAAFYGRPLEVRVSDGVTVGCIGAAAPVWGSLERGAGAVADGLTLRTSGVDVTALYRAGEDCFATHEVAAAFLASGSVAVRPGALAELLAFGHPANERGMLEGVTVVPAASEIDLAPAARPAASPAAPPPATRSAAPRHWHLPAENDAREEAGSRLVASLASSLAGLAEVRLGLSAGADSHVAGAALRVAGVPFRAFTWGPPGSPDVVGATRAARVLGVEHDVVTPVAYGAEEALARAEQDARWLDGASGLGLTGGAGFGDATIVTGVGGELARAYHYRFSARNRRSPSLDDLAATWRPQAMLPAGTDAGAVDAVARAARRALEGAAAEAGVDGWRVLDVVYATQRMRRWGRAQIRPTRGLHVPAFLAPEVAAALVALPLEDRLGDGFHRAFLARHAPELVPGPPPRQRRGVPAPLRRGAARLRGAPGAPGSPPAPPPAVAERLRAVAADPLVEEALGPAARLEPHHLAALFGAVTLAAAARDL